MKKYLRVITSTWEEVAAYRFNFAMWRFRNVLQFLTVYYLWFTVTPPSGQIFGYSQSLILTYILGVSFLSSIVLATRTQEIGDNINSGDLSLFLIRPLNYFYYWLARDIGDKASNIFFAIFEITILFILLKPPIFIQTDLFLLLFVGVSLIVAVFLNFFIGCLLGFIGFWSSEVWAPRFIFYIIVMFLAGGIFPLDIFPQGLNNFLQVLPFTYLLYFPLKIYLGQLSFLEITNGIAIAFLWIIILYIATRAIWLKGLKIYSSQGR